MLVQQKSVCYICKQPETVRVNGKLRPLCVDHDHKTGAVRKLLCNACNTALGGYERLRALGLQQKLEEYLLHHDTIAEWQTK